MSPELESAILAMIAKIDKKLDLLLADLSDIRETLIRIQ
jgi:hypothetical protein